MKIILMEDVPALGRRGELREVKTGYARNFLLPKRLAVEATPTNLQNLDHLKRQRERAEQHARAEAETVAARIAGLTLTVTTRASDDGRLYGSVTAQDVVQFLEGQKLAVEKRRIILEEPIKALGEYQVPIRLHHDVTATLRIVVGRE
ncbi:MAG: 50S ribosomal protein L9 [Candidatus Rokuibacteriota bacterium]